MKSSVGIQLLSVTLILMTGFAITGVVPSHVNQIAAETPEEAEIAIRKTLVDQAKAWNKGDIVEFMDGYIKSGKLRFSSGGSVRRGWQEALERYQANYSTREKMGTLTFSDFEFMQISPEFAEVFGKYHLKRDASVGDNSGIFTLLMQKVGDRWLVLHDHTSTGE